MVESLEFKRKVISLLKEDEEFRLAVAGLLGFDAILNEVRRLREDFNKFVELEAKRWEENNKKWEENNKRWEESNRRWEENNKRWEEAYKRFEVIESELKGLREDFNKYYVSVMRRMDFFERRADSFERKMVSFERRMIALGARWGIESEEAFREAMKGFVEELFGVDKVERWVYYDEGGEVFGYPSQVEVDVLVKDGSHILIEVKSSVSDSDVAKLWRIGNLYSKVTGFKPMLVIVTPFIDEKGLEAAKRLGVKVFTDV